MLQILNSLKSKFSSSPAFAATKITLTDGTKVTIRPIRPEDEPRLIKFHEGLSERSVFFRWFTDLPLSQRIAHEELSRLWTADPRRQTALVAVSADPQTKATIILGLASITVPPGETAGEFGLIVSDQLQHHGLGTALLERLVQVAHARKLSGITGDIHPENRPMQKLCRKLGCDLKFSLEEHVVKAKLQFG